MKKLGLLVVLFANCFASDKMPLSITYKCPNGVVRSMYVSVRGGNYDQPANFVYDQGSPFNCFSKMAELYFEQYYKLTGKGIHDESGHEVPQLKTLSDLYNMKKLKEVAQNNVTSVIVALTKK